MPGAILGLLGFEGNAARSCKTTSTVRPQCGVFEQPVGFGFYPAVLRRIAIETPARGLMRPLWTHRSFQTSDGPIFVLLRATISGYRRHRVGRTGHGTEALRFARSSAYPTLMAIEVAMGTSVAVRPFAPVAYTRTALGRCRNCYLINFGITVACVPIKKRSGASGTFFG